MLGEDRHLIDYLPPVLQRVLEFQAINEGCEPEIMAAWGAYWLLLDNQFLETATEVGVGIWERELGLHPKDNDTLEIRKERIRSMWLITLPYTYRWLENWLAGVCGEDGFTMSLTDYTLDIELYYDRIENPDILTNEIISTLLNVIPCNIVMQIAPLQEEYGTMVCAGTTEAECIAEIWPEIIRERETDGGFYMQGPIETRISMDVYPEEG